MKWLVIFPLLIVSVIVAVTIYLQPNNFMGCADAPSEDVACTKADAIVVISGGDTSARTNTGINLYKNGWADKLIVSGAAQDKTGLSNAAAMKLQALQAGVPEDAIIIDENASNTQENAENSQTIFEENGFSNIILVTSGYHQRRSSLEFNKRTTDVTIRNHPVVKDRDWSYFWWVTPRGWWLAGGEMAKITAFYMGLT